MNSLGALFLPLCFQQLIGSDLHFFFFLCWLIPKPQGWIGKTFEGAAALCLAFIVLLAYTYWLGMSSDNLSGLGSGQGSAAEPQEHFLS